MTPAAAPTVFVVDDDAGVRASIQGLLKSADCVPSPSGPRKSSYAVSVGRAKLPGSGCEASGINGLDFQRQLAEAGIQIPIIFVTGHGDIPMTVKAMKSGAVEFLTKPFDDQDLLNAIHQALDRDRERRGSRVSLPSCENATRR